MKKTFLTASLIFLTIVSLTTLAQINVFDHMPLAGNIPGFKAPVREAFNVTDTPLISSFKHTVPASSPLPSIGCPFASPNRSLPAMDPGFTGSLLKQSLALGTSSPFSGFPSRVAEDEDMKPASSSGYKLYDTFDSLRSDLWTVSSYRPDSDTLTSTFVPSNVWFRDGKLVLRSMVDDNTGGEYKSNDKFYLGKYRASIKIDQVPGTYLTFFAYMWPSGQGSNIHNEIDIELIVNRGRATAMLSTWSDYVKTQYLYTLHFDPSADYHTYGFDWYTDRVEFYIDDMTRPVWTSTSNIPQDPMYVYFNSWVDKDTRTGRGNDVSTEYVDWVTVE